jgi:hypothetical protein
MATSQVSVFREALRSAVAASLTAGPTVYAYDPGSSNTDSVGELVYFGTATANQSHLTFGGARQEEISLDVIIYVRRPGAGQTQAKAAEDRALELFGEIEDAIRDDPDLNAVFHVQVTGPNEVEAIIDAGNRGCLLRGTVEGEAHI